MRKLKGVVAVVPTPLTKEEDIDLAGTESLVEMLVSHELPLFILGSAGESMNLTFANRIAFARKVAEVNAGRVPLLVGGGGFGVKDSLSFIETIADYHIDGVHIIPYDGKISASTVEQLYVSLADRSPVPIWVYQNTTRSNGIPVDIVKYLSNHENIHGAKLAGFDLRVNQAFIELNRDDFQIFGSADSQMFSFLCHGLSASSSSSAACFPELFKNLYEVFQQDSITAARERNREIMSFIKRLPKGAYLDNGESAAEVKYQLALRGICAPHVARPWREQTDDEKRVGAEVHKDYMHYIATGELRT